MPDEIMDVARRGATTEGSRQDRLHMAQKARLPAFKVRGQWRFKRIDLDRWIEQQKANSRNEKRS